MIYLLSVVIVILLFILGALLRKIYELRLDKPFGSGRGGDLLKTTWGKFDELLTSLLTIYEPGIVNAGPKKRNSSRPWWTAPATDNSPAGPDGL